MKKLLIAAAVAGLAALNAAQAAEVTLRVHYAHPNLWKNVQELMAKNFMAANPGIKIELDAPAKTYADGAQQLLREAVANKLPDLAYVGLNRWRILEARGLLAELDPLVGDAAAFEAKGYTPALRSLGQYKGKQYALAASASTLVMYVNPELVKKAGGSMDSFPRDFDGLIALAGKISALGGGIDGVWVDPHDWRFQSMLGSYGGRPMNDDETAITFDSPAGVAAATLYSRFAKEAGMKKYGGNEARQAFAAGTLGIYIDSSSYLTRMIEGAGDRFKVTVEPFIVAAQDTSKVYFPTGGSAIVMFTKDKAKQAAAWKYMMYATGPDGAKMVVENSGYAPTNALVLQDKSYLGDFYAKNENARRAHAQVSAHAGPWYAYPGAEGVAVTDLIGAGLVEIIDGADPAAKIKEVADDVRGKLKMK
ncbi:MAG: extracellular solute-binding protein [Hyphomicrobiales bacterium]|nr:extracellular solute-binding protein [Hyphomicrobiales bacterium]MCP5370358.1 extracellular solute-binding protein [Hyphomicrobiales bacterium]